MVCAAGPVAAADLRKRRGHHRHGEQLRHCAWRGDWLAGFLVPQLAKVTSFTRLSLLSGLIWSLWHYPILLFADYNSGTPAW